MGEIVNLMSVDAERIALLFCRIVEAVTIVPQLIAVTALAYRYVGWSVFVSMAACVALTVFINQYLMVKLSRVEDDLMNVRVAFKLIN